METIGRLIDRIFDVEQRRQRLTFLVEDCSDEEFERLQRADRLDVKVVVHREKRSKDANALLWACLSEIAVELRTDKWSVYLMMLKRYGKHTYLVAKEQAVESVRRQWREIEVVGDTTMHTKDGKPIPMKQLLCYFGSSTYNTKEFSVLLDGVISEMEEMGLTPPPSGDIKRALEKLEHDNS